MRVYSFIIFSISMLFGCSTSTVEEDLEEYCHCINTANVPSEIRECLDLAQVILDKYSFDSEASSYISHHVDSCGLSAK